MTLHLWEESTTNIYTKLKQSDAAIIIFGAGAVGHFILKCCRRYKLEITSFCDNRLENLGKTIEDIPIDNIDNLVVAHDKMIFILASSIDLEGITAQIRSHGDYEFVTVDKFYTLDEVAELDHVTRHKLEVAYYAGRWYSDRDSGKVRLLDAEFYVTERCSLKCRDCILRIPYYRTPKDAPIDNVKRDIDRITDICDEIYELAFLGGEPLLYGDLDQAIAYVNGKSNVHNLMIVTNGTLVPSDRVMEAVVNNDRCRTYFSVSNYGANSRKLDDLQEKCAQYGVSCEVRKMEFWIRKPPVTKYNRSSEELENVYKLCMSKYCFTIKDGKFYRCPIMAQELKLRAMPDDPDCYVDLMAMDDIDELRRQMMAYLSPRKYFSLCDYCQPISVVNVREEDKVIPAGVQLKSPPPYHEY